MLLSTKCGGTGTNLTLCDYMVQMDTSWSAAQEGQVNARIIRFEQRANAVVIRLFYQKSIEENIKFLQLQKKTVCDTAHGKLEEKLTTKKVLAVLKESENFIDESQMKIINKE